MVCSTFTFWRPLITLWMVRPLMCHRVYNAFTFEALIFNINTEWRQQGTKLNGTQMWIAVIQDQLTLLYSYFKSIFYLSHLFNPMHFDTHIKSVHKFGTYKIYSITFQLTYIWKARQLKFGFIRIFCLQLVWLISDQYRIQKYRNIEI